MCTSEELVFQNQGELGINQIVRNNSDRKKKWIKVGISRKIVLDGKYLQAYKNKKTKTQKLAQQKSKALW